MGDGGGASGRRGRGDAWCEIPMKAKDVTDVKGDKQRAAGHKDPEMVHVYDRKPIDVDATQ